MSHSHADHARKAATLHGCRSVVLLVGTPNSGKSTIFSQVAGGEARIANWPGVTVDIQYHQSDGVCIVDAPGAYSMDGGTIEEEILVEAVTRLKPTKIILVIDGLQPEAGIYLLLQLLEAYTGSVEVLITKSLLSHGSGIHIDAEGLSRSLGVPVTSVSILEGVGLEEAKKAVLGKPAPRSRAKLIDYGPLEAYIHILESMIGEKASPISPRWLAVQLLAGDPVARGLVASINPKAVEEADRIKASLVGGGVDPEEAIARARIDAAEAIARRHVVRRTPGELGDRIDGILLNPIIGPIAGATILFSAFFIVFSLTIGFPLNIILDAVGLEAIASMVEEYSLVGIASSLFEAILGAIPREGALWGLAAGIISGVGVVASFIPLIAIATAVLAVLEDSGIMTRIAVALHPFMERLGVSGRSVYPYLLGLGCNVPAVLTSRLLPPWERARVLFSIPFVICSARLIVLLAFTFAFFHTPLQQAAVAVSIYLVSALAALASAKVATLLVGSAGERPHLVMELPPMHKPSARVVWWSVRSSLAHFIRKMAGPITLAAIVIWLLLEAPAGESSIGRSIGGVVGSIFKPIGVDPGTAEVLGLAGLAGSLVKEVIVETIGVAYGVADPRGAVAALGLSPSQAYSILVFFMLYTPCIATAVSIYTESRSPRLLLALILYSITLATALMYASYTILEVASRWL